MKHWEGGLEVVPVWGLTLGAGHPRSESPAPPGAVQMLAVVQTVGQRHLGA